MLFSTSRSERATLFGCGWRSSAEEVCVLIYLSCRIILCCWVLCTRWVACTLTCFLERFFAYTQERERRSRTFLCMYQMVSSPTCETWFSVFLSDTECGCKGPVRLCFSTVGCRVDLCHYECLRFSPFLHMCMRTIFVELLPSARSHFCRGLSTYDVVSIRRTFCVHVTSLPLLRVLFQDSRDSGRREPRPDLFVYVRRFRVPWSCLHLLPKLALLVLVSHLPPCTNMSLSFSDYHAHVLCEISIVIYVSTFTTRVTAKSPSCKNLFFVYIRVDFSSDVKYSCSCLFKSFTTSSIKYVCYLAQGVCLGKYIIKKGIYSAYICTATDLCMCMYKCVFSTLVLDRKYVWTV